MMQVLQFEPLTQQEMDFFGKTYIFGGTRSGQKAPAFVGRVAKTYRIRCKTCGNFYCLKVFKGAFRGPNAEMTFNLNKLRSVGSLRAAARRVQLQERPLPDLVLMPWVDGETWSSKLSAASRGRGADRAGAMKMALRFLETMSRLEKSQLAHTDISPANVIYDDRRQAIELVDLEGMFAPGWSQPFSDIPGTRFYQHGSEASTWKAPGDRYAAAILASEMLIMSDRTLAQSTSEDSYYQGTCDTETGMKQFSAAAPYLKSIAPNLFESLNKAWFSKSLVECPSLGSLEAALLRDLPQPPVNFSPSGDRSSAPRVWRTLPHPIPVAAANIVSGIVFEKGERRPSNSVSVADSAPAQTLSSPEFVPFNKHSSSQRRLLILFFLLCLLSIVLFAMWFHERM